MTNDEFDTSNYIAPTHVIPKALKIENEKCAVIISPGGTYHGKKKGDNGEEEAYQKLYVDVEFPSGRRYQYRMSPKQCEALADELGTNRRLWVGAQLAFTPQDRNGMQWCDATVIAKPGPTQYKPN